MKPTRWQERGYEKRTGDHESGDSGDTPELRICKHRCLWVARQMGEELFSLDLRAALEC